MNEKEYQENQYLVGLAYLDCIKCRVDGCEEMRFVDFDHIVEVCKCGDPEYCVLNES